MIKTRGLASHKRVEQEKKSDEKNIDIFPKLTRISIIVLNERKARGLFSFYDGSMVISSRAQVFNVFREMNTRHVQDDVKVF